MYGGSGATSLLIASRLSGTIRGMRVRRRMGDLSLLLPNNAVDTRTIEIDIHKSYLGGMTFPVAPGASSPIIPVATASGRVQFTPLDFREKFTLNGTDYVDLRRLGTQEESTSKMTIAGRFAAMLQQRIETRLEFLRAHALFRKSISVTLGGSTVTVNYPHASYFEPSATAAWSGSSSVPLTDLTNFFGLMEEPSPNSRKFLYLRPEQLKNIRKTGEINSVWDEIFKYSTGFAKSLGLVQDKNVLTDGVAQVMAAYLGNQITVVPYDRSVSYFAATTAATTSGSAVVNVNDSTGFAVGDSVTLQNRETQQYKVMTISSISGNAVTMTENVGEAFPVNTIVRCESFFLPLDTVCGVVVPDSGMFDESSDSLPFFFDSQNPIPDNVLGQTIMAQPNYFVDDSRNVGGPFVVVNDLPHEDPPRIEMIGGVSALPRIDYGENYFLADVS